MFRTLLFSLISQSVISSIITVDNLNVENYLGRWYQVFGSPTNVIFQGYGECITADYNLLDNGNIDVLNSQINRNGEYETIGGYAFYKNISEPGKLTVHLDGTPVDAPYWVVNLGPIIDNQYDYSIVTAPSGISLWTLVRDPYNYDREQIESYLQENNYNYVEIKQSNC